MDFAEVADLVEDLVRESINRLDSVYIGPLFERASSPAEGSAVDLASAKSDDLDADHP